MNCIILSPESFLVNTHGENGCIANQIFCISTKKTSSTPIYSGGTNNNVPEYNLVKKEDWEKSTKDFPVIPLESHPNLLELFNKVNNAHEATFESVEDFVESHHQFPE